ncbi:hypothetical protein BC940DRAFT_286756 [Gongronella butleri]|nr:hypothetical protein BC940DRAFT_286756 [Gongronella butleri]
MSLSIDFSATRSPNASSNTSSNASSSSRSSRSASPSLSPPSRPASPTHDDTSSIMDMAIRKKKNKKRSPLEQTETLRQSFEEDEAEAAMAAGLGSAAVTSTTGSPVLSQQRQSWQSTRLPTSASQESLRKSASNLSLSSMTLRPSSMHLEEIPDQVDAPGFTPVPPSRTQIVVSIKTPLPTTSNEPIPAPMPRHPHAFHHHHHHHPHRTRKRADYSQLAPPYTTCPLISSSSADLRVPDVRVPFFHYARNTDTDRFDELVQTLAPYPFRTREPQRKRLERKKNTHTASPPLMPLPAYLTAKRHSIDVGQIERIEHPLLLKKQQQQRQDTNSTRGSDLLSPHAAATAASGKNGHAIDTLKDVPYTRPIINDDYQEIMLHDRIQWILQQKQYQQAFYHGSPDSPVTAAQQRHLLTPSPTPNLPPPRI